MPMRAACACVVQREAPARAAGWTGCLTASPRGLQAAAASELARRLGQLPLALAMAAAYMRRCDVRCGEYLERYLKQQQLLERREGALPEYSRSVSSSLEVRSLSCTRRQQRRE